MVARTDKPITEPARLLSIQAAAKVLGDINHRTVRRLLDDGVIEGVHLGRRRLVVASSLDAYVEQLRKRSREPAA